MSQINYSRYKYTPDEMNEQDFLERFVVRKEIFEHLFSEIKSANYEITNQHYIIVGQRGQGKTTLLRKIQLEVQNDEELSKFLLPVKFAEEQYQIRSLCRLWEEVADYLQTIYENEFATILDDMENHFEDDDYDLRCFSYFESVLKSKKKKLILLIDNIDELFGKLKPKEQQQLREILLSTSSFIIIGGSSKMFDQQYDYSKPFYEFFKIIKVQGLNYEESIKLLQAIGKGEQKKKIEKVILETPERIETLRRLTGGVPRTMIMLFDIFTDEDGNAFEDLLKVLDEVTPLYKHRMDDLPPPLQDIVHVIALNWDGMFTKDIAKKTRLQSKEVSAQLKQLEKYQLIESETTGKNKIYKIQERFFNIWYLMRFGRKKDRHKVEWLVKFLLSWFSHTELEKRAHKLIDSLKNGKIQESYVYHMCEALSYAGLDLETEYKMKNDVKEYLNGINSKLVDELSQSDVEILKQALIYEENNEIENAIKLILSSQKSTKEISGFLGFLYRRDKEYSKAEIYYLKAIEYGDINALGELSMCYFIQGIKSKEALDLIEKSYTIEPNFSNIYIFSIILLWNEEFSKSYEKFLEWLEYENALEDGKSIILYLIFLLSKGQCYKVKEFFEIEKYQFKDRYKPIWYALMILLKKEFPDEMKKMGSELQESVDEVLAEIERLKVQDAI